jgi:hypothetical protein
MKLAQLPRTISGCEPADVSPEPSTKTAAVSSLWQLASPKKSCCESHAAQPAVIRPHAAWLQSVAEVVQPSPPPRAPRQAMRLARGTGGVKTSTVERTDRKNFLSGVHRPESFPGNGSLLEGFRKAQGALTIPHGTTQSSACLPETHAGWPWCETYQRLPGLDCV